MSGSPPSTAAPGWPITRVTPSNNPHRAAHVGNNYAVVGIPTTSTAPASVATAGQGQSDSTPTRSTTNGTESTR